MKMTILGLVGVEFLRIRAPHLISTKKGNQSTKYVGIASQLLGAYAPVPRSLRP